MVIEIEKKAKHARISCCEAFKTQPMPLLCCAMIKGHVTAMAGKGRLHNMDDLRGNNPAVQHKTGDLSAAL